MLVKTVRCLALVAIILMWISPHLCAQEGVSPVPEPVYAPTGNPSPTDVAVPMPESDPGGDGSVVTVPIPGGGTVIVEGPDLQPETMHSPIETWGATQVAPNSITGQGVLGPGPH